MNAAHWQRMDAHWQDWMRVTLVELRAKVAEGDEQAQLTLMLWNAYQAYPLKLKSRPALTRAVRATGWGKR